MGPLPFNVAFKHKVIPIGVINTVHYNNYTFVIPSPELQTLLGIKLCFILSYVLYINMHNILGVNFVS